MRVIEAAVQRPWRRCCASCGQSLPAPEVAEPDEAAVQRRVYEGIRCGVVMVETGEPCARRAGHRDSHRSRYVMDAAALDRRSRKLPPWEEAS